MVARLSRTLCHQVLRVEAVELRRCSRRDEDHRHRRERHRVHVAQRQRRDEAIGVRPHRAQRRRSRRTTRRRAGSSRWSARSLSAARSCRRCRAARTRCARPIGSAACGAGAAAPRGMRVAHRPSRIVRDQRRAGLARPRPAGRARAPGSATASTISLWPIRYSSSAERISALIGTTLTPSALSASQWKKKDGRLSSSRPTR